MSANRKTSPLQIFLLIFCLLLLVAVIVFVMLHLNKDSADSIDPAPQQSQSSSASLQTTPTPTTPVTESIPAPDPADFYGEALPKSEPVTDSYFDDALFVGDSITTGIEAYGVMPNTTVVASTGINPNTIMSSPVIETVNGTVTILDAMSAYHPKKIYIMLGSNGVQFIGKETMMELYGTFVDAVKNQHPDSVIYLQSILPVTQAKVDANPDLTNEKIDEYNEAIMALAKEKEVYYLNVGESLKDASGALPDEASPNDGMHFGKPRYEIWMAYLKSHTLEGALKGSAQN
ncbi:GDSL-type esterase/lipase family protein [Zongyangia hominis]|uniref:SGNH hydrolase-type esterase domain-containing protein n=1 Tax=Zongyangia hominis TaxID=2763677 RepID=A0A926EDK2_9FIRM|nr:GDSL-type esterase/lipase family protein [Zongyangia hominis]MBC8571120.1 hypothetical protein [Zongyangia hominis]